MAFEIVDSHCHLDFPDFDGELPAIIARADDTDAGVRLQAAYTLGEWREPAAGEALARLLRREDDRFVKAAAMSSAVASLRSRGPPLQTVNQSRQSGRAASTRSMPRTRRTSEMS